MDAEKLKEIGVQICIPGMRLSAANKEYASGPGTYELKGYIYATLAGLLKMLVDEKTQVTIVTVESPRTPSVLPKTGDVVTAKVTVVNPRQVNCAILCVGPSVLARPYRGVLKKEDIRATDKDRIDPYKCYRPGDVILARVVSFYPKLAAPRCVTHIGLDLLGISGQKCAYVLFQESSYLRSKFQLNPSSRFGMKK